MVRTTWLCGLFGLALGMAAVPASADGILEQMQNEIAGIVHANKGAIVSIEDDVIMQSSDANPRTNYALRTEQQLKAQRLATLLARKGRIEAELAGFTVIYKANAPQVSEVEHSKEALDKEIQALQKEIERDPQADQMNHWAERACLTELEAKKQDLEAQLAQLTTVYKPTAIQVQEATRARDLLLQQIAQTQQALRGDQHRPGRTAPPNPPKSGSGFCIGNGYVVTTADVLDGMKNPLVIFDDGTRMRAKVIGIDPDQNLGLLKLPAKAEVAALKLGNSDLVAPGHFAISIGNQNGHANSVALTMVAGIRTEGFFSGTHFYPSLIQIAGTVGAGTSGAPILNARGEVVGMIAAIPVGDWTETQVFPDFFFSWAQKDFIPPITTPSHPNGAQPQPGKSGAPQDNALPPPPPVLGTGPGFSPQPAASGGYGAGYGGNPPQGITYAFIRPPVTSAGFAIPINDMQPIIQEFEAGRPIVHTWMGVDMRDRPKWSEDEGIIKFSRIVRITNVYPDSPALKGGLQVGDVLVSLNGKQVTSIASVRSTIIRLRPGDTLAVQINRSGTAQKIDLKIEARPDVQEPGKKRGKL